MVSSRVARAEDSRATGELEKNPVWVKAMQRAMVFESTPTASTADAFHGLCKPSAENAGTVFENAPKESRADFSHGLHCSPTEAAQAMIQAACDFVEEDGLPSSIYENTPEASMASVSSTKPVEQAEALSSVYENNPLESMAAAAHGDIRGQADEARDAIAAAAEDAAAALEEEGEREVAHAAAADAVRLLETAEEAQPERRQRRSRGQGARQDEEEVIFVGCSAQAPTMLIAATGREQAFLQPTPSTAATERQAVTALGGRSVDRQDDASIDEASMRKLGLDDSNTSEADNGTQVIRHGTNSTQISSTDKLAKAALAATTGQQQRVVRAYPGNLAQTQVQVNPASVSTHQPHSQRGVQQPKVPSVQISLLKELNAAQKVPIPGGVDWNLGLGDTDSQTSASSISDDEGPLPDMALEAARQGTPGPVAPRAAAVGQLAPQGSSSVLGGGGRMIGWSSVPDGLGRLAMTVGEPRQSASARTNSVGPAENQGATSMHTTATLPRRTGDYKVVANSASSGPIQSVAASTMWQPPPLYVPSTTQSLAPPRSSTGLKEEDRGDTKDSSFDSMSSGLYTGLFGLNTPRQNKSGASAGVPPSASSSKPAARTGIVSDRGSFGYRPPVSKQQAQQPPSSAPPTPRQFLLGGGGSPHPQPAPVQVVSGTRPMHAAATSLTSPRQVSVERAAPGDSRRSPLVAGPTMYGDSARLSAGAGRSPFMGSVSQPTPPSERSPGSLISGLPCRPHGANMSSVAPAGQPGKVASGCLPNRPRDATANGMQLYTPRTTQQPGQQRPDAKQRAGGAARRDREISPDVTMPQQVPSGVATAMSLSPRSYTSLGLGATSSRGAPAPTAAPSVPLWHARR
mmetsp:Transcript_14728/g.33460  ORF Transcript_14728/g.33460 Transcript_14728/m.33460 type:complete len:859 (+) Transcript_14728:53-2629(+)